MKKELEYKYELEENDESFELWIDYLKQCSLEWYLNNTTYFDGFMNNQFEHSVNGANAIYWEMIMDTIWDGSYGEG